VNKDLALVKLLQGHYENFVMKTFLTPTACVQSRTLDFFQKTKLKRGRSNVAVHRQTWTPKISLAYGYTKTRRQSLWCRSNYGKQAAVQQLEM